jgi:hypothetical protein
MEAIMQQIIRLDASLPYSDSTAKAIQARTTCIARLDGSGGAVPPVTIPLETWKGGGTR